jgi:hypothetical protein
MWTSVSPCIEARYEQAVRGTGGRGGSGGEGSSYFAYAPPTAKWGAPQVREELVRGVNRLERGSDALADAGGRAIEVGRCRLNPS